MGDSDQTATQPRLRPLEAVPMLDGNGARLIALRDPSRLSDVMLTLSEPALFLVSLFDGQHSFEQMQGEFAARYGESVDLETIRQMADHLTGAHFLAGPAFEAYRADLASQYRAAPLRPMRDTMGRGLGARDIALEFNRILDEASPAELPGNVVGLIAPHLDYPRGRPCYGAAYRALAQVREVCRAVVLGTNHFGFSTSVVTTAKPFGSPLGTTPVDEAFIEALERRLGASLREHEMDHAREHSVELQVLWLQHLFGAERFKLAPFLCPDPCGPSGTASYDGRGPDLLEFAAALREVLDESGEPTLLVAGADMSHFGAQFGDQRELDETFRAEVQARDRRALCKLEANDVRSFIASVAEQANPTRVCSVGCMSALMAALPDAKVTVLGYHQAVDQPSQTAVSCTAAAFTVA